MENDLISRAAAIEAIEQCCAVTESAKETRECCAAAIASLVPAVDAAPVVHAWWVDEAGNHVPWSDDLPSSPAYSCWCSQCHTWLIASDEYPVDGLFCPVCGARMDGDPDA